MPTDSHDDQKARDESPQFYDAVVPTVHEIIPLLGFAAYPVRERRNDISPDHEQGQVGFEEGGGEDDHEEAYGENLA
jgi:hypothetical protein